MVFFPSRPVVVILLLLSVTGAYSSDLDQELRTTLAVTNVALAHHSQALSQLLQTQERSQLESHGISQALIQMAQGFQVAVTQLSQELSPLIQLNKELATQQSSSLTKLIQMAENMKATQTQMNEELIACQSQMAEIRVSESQMTLEMRASHSQLAEELRASQKNITEVLTETLTTLLNQQQSETRNDSVQEIPQTLPTVTTRPSLSVPPEAEVVSDGVFLIVRAGKSWDDAKNHCREMGAHLASPPSDMEAFKNFVYKAIVGSDAWLGGREEGFGGYKYLDGVPVQSSHWYWGEAKHPNVCVYINAAFSPPLWAFGCTNTLSSICRFVSAEGENGR